MRADRIDDSFVRIDGSWSAASAGRLLAALTATTTHAIVTDGDPPRYYAFGIGLLRRALRGCNSCVRNALELDRRTPTPAVPADDLPAAGAGLVVALEGDVLCGLFDGQTYLDVQPARSASDVIGGELSLRGPAAVADGARVRIAVELQLRGARRAEASAVEFLVEASRTSGDPSITTEPSSSEAMLRASVDVTAQGLGQGGVTVRAIACGQPIAKATLRFAIDRAGASERRVDAPVRGERSPDAGLTMVVDEAGDGSYRVLVHGAHGELAHRRFGPIAPPRRLLGDLSAQVGELQRATGGREADARIAAWGERLCEALMPRELSDFLWQLRDRLSSLYIVSDDHALPWELCRLTGRDATGRIEGGFLCEMTALTRWVMDTPPPTMLAVDRIALIVPGDSRLPDAEAERRELFDTSPGVSMIPASFVEVREALARGEHDVWHFAGHGLYDATRPGRPSLLLDDDGRLEPDDICGVVRNLARRSPIIVLNACHTAPLPLGTGIEAWSHRFVAAGASAFIGTRWQVRDSTARRFARTFYAGLRRGVALGEAVRDARRAIDDDGLTSLAYTVFGHPLARVTGSS